MPALAHSRAALAALCGLAALAAAAALGRTPAALFAAKLLVLAPVVEELFFRAVVHRWLLERTGGLRSWPLSAANVATAVLFGAAHLVYGTPPLAAATVAPALAIGFVYERTRRVDLCIGLHAAFNAFWLTATGGAP
jgi:membrane protease YdiL (CAAX protease family)